MNWRPSSSWGAVTVMAGAVWAGVVGAVWSAGAGAGGWTWATAAVEPAKGRMNASPASSRRIACPLSRKCYTITYKPYDITFHWVKCHSCILFTFFIFDDLCTIGVYSEHANTAL